MPYLTVDIPAGTRFDRLITLEPPFLKPRSDGRKRSHVRVRCNCGTEKVVAAGNLLSGNTTSCGCLQRDLTRARMTTHGESAGYRRTRLLSVWKGMKQRCLNPKASNYQWYGGKGVSLCEEWNTFEGFRDWAVSAGYKDDLELDRLDPNGNYEPLNCVWVTKSENLRRMRQGLTSETETLLRDYARNTGKSLADVIELALKRFLSEGVIS